MPLKGITWSHPRGYLPVDALARRRRDVTWSRHSLSGFESTPISDLAEQHDLIILDHPGLGAALDALWPLDELVNHLEIVEWEQRFVGESTASYALDGHQWAVPIDAAAQVCSTSPQAPPVQHWGQIGDYPGELRLAVPLRTPHALLTFLGICAAVGGLQANDDELVSRDVALPAWDVMRSIVARTPPDSLDRDPIELLGAIADGRLDCSPLVFSYINYVDRNHGRPVRFSDAPSFVKGGKPGSVLGGTGLAISRRTKDPAAALEVLRDLASVETQAGEYVAAGGQPSANAAWRDPGLDSSCGGFFSATLATQISAWRRPRFNGWIETQTRGSQLIEGALGSATPPWQDLNDLYRSQRSKRSRPEC